MRAISRQDRIVARLRRLQELNPEIEAVAAVSVEGLLIASDLQSDLEDERISAMSAAMLGLGERIAMELKRGALNEFLIRGDLGIVILLSVNDEAVLTALATEEAKLGLVLLDMRRTAEDLRSEL